MVWILVVAVVGAIGLLTYSHWRKWIFPWTGFEDLLRQISRGETPRTFLIDGANRPRQVALMLENLFDRQQKLDQQIAERAAGTQTIFAAMQDGLLAVDAQRRLTLMNRILRELFGLGEELLGTPLLEVVRNVELDRLIAETLRTGAPHRAELSVSSARDGSSRQMQLSVVATSNDLGQATGAVVLFHDITQLKQADEVRRDFVANVSHELRTPLSILRGYLETLLDDPETSPEERTRMLEVMKRHTKRLGALVDDLLTLAQLESINTKLQFSDVRLSELFAGIVRDWGNKFAEKKLSIDVALDPNVPIIRADEVRLQEILYNLLDNALKYSRIGGKIRLQGQRRDDKIVLTVSDAGIGIDEADLPRIFERFYRTDKARTREHGGTGLGLSIVKHIAQMHGGTVEAESKVGQGTTIRVILPLDQEHPKALVTES